MSVRLTPAEDKYLRALATAHGAGHGRTLGREDWLDALGINIERRGAKSTFGRISAALIRKGAVEAYYAERIGEDAYMLTSAGQRYIKEAQ